MKINYLIIITILFIVVACQQEKKLITINEYSTLPALKIEIDEPILESLDNQWAKGISNNVETSKFDINQMPILTDTVSLPDKNNLNPYTSIWYEKTINPDKEYVLLINPDDGAQVFLNSIFSDPLKANVYDLSSYKGLDHLTITIRCMNQAMHGGLREAGIIEKKYYEAYISEVEMSNTLLKLINKQKLIPELNSKINDFVGNAILSDDIDSLKSAINLLSNYPINLVDPFLQKTDSIIHILWESDINTSAKFIWGYDSTNLEFSETIHADSLNMYRFSNTFETGKTVFYKIQYVTTQTKLYNFTVSEPTENINFFVWGDSQSGWQTFSKLSNHMATYPADFSIGVGDLVNNGINEDEYRKLHRSHYPVSGKIPVYLIPGNHDYDGYYKFFSADNFHKYSFNSYDSLKGNYYSFTEGNAMFIALDPNENFPLGIPAETKQYKWFFEQLESNKWKNAQWRFILVHQPPYSQGWPGYHGAPPITDLLEPLYEKYKIDAVISGHTHDYERLSKTYGEQTVQFLISGAAGGGIEPLRENSEWPVMDTIIKEHLFVHVSLEKNKANFKAINTENKIVDKFEIVK